MTTRILPPEEWPRLVGTEAERFWPFLRPETSKIVVVEKDGAIVGCHVLTQVLHAECLWIHPDYRQKSSVGRRLWATVQEVARSFNVYAFMTHAVDDAVKGLLKNVGATPVAGESFMVSVMSNEDRADSAIGRVFHEQLERQLTHDNHPDDPAHNRAVGHALRAAIECGDVDGAVSGYNRWAALSGYVPFELVGHSDDSWRLDMQTAVIEIARDYSVKVIEERTCQ